MLCHLPLSFEPLAHRNRLGRTEGINCVKASSKSLTKLKYQPSCPWVPFLLMALATMLVCDLNRDVLMSIQCLKVPSAYFCTNLSS